VHSIDNPKNPISIQGEDILVEFDEEDNEDDYENVEDNSSKKIEEKNWKYIYFFYLFTFLQFLLLSSAYWKQVLFSDVASFSKGRGYLSFQMK